MIQKRSTQCKTSNLNSQLAELLLKDAIQRMITQEKGLLEKGLLISLHFSADGRQLAAILVDRNPLWPLPFMNNDSSRFLLQGLNPLSSKTNGLG